MKIKNTGWKIIKKHLENDRPLTTFEVSKICGVVHSTVSNWINQGKLTAFRTVGKHRRIKKQHLLLFMELHQIPIPEEILSFLTFQNINEEKEKASVKKSGGQKKIALIGKDSLTLTLISETLKKWRNDCEITSIADAYEAGKYIANGSPNIVIIDFSDSQQENLSMAEKIRHEKNCLNSKILAVVLDTIPDKNHAHFDGIITKPIDLYKLTSQMNRLLHIK